VGERVNAEDGTRIVYLYEAVWTTSRIKYPTWPKNKNKLVTHSMKTLCGLNVI